ncbi:hypothetical protein HDU76_013683 [Blyttiomyces sp. JEL0837]|nr:hypothetical protein HDU76_013683 [Blyttiomyces sp. JEL0837]
MSSVIAYLLQVIGQKTGALKTTFVLLVSLFLDQAPWIISDYIMYYQFILIMVANSGLHLIFWKLFSPLTWSKVFGEWLHFTLALWVTWILLTGSFIVGYNASGIADNWTVSMGTVLYIGMFYPLGKSALMWVLQRQLFWVTLRKSLKKAGADEIVMLGYQMNVFYIYDLLFSLAGKILILRARNLFTFYLSLLGSTAFRISSRFLASVLLLRRMMEEANHPIPSPALSSMTMVATGKVSPTVEGSHDIMLPSYANSGSDPVITSDLNLSCTSTIAIEAFRKELGTLALEDKSNTTIQSSLTNFVIKPADERVILPSSSKQSPTTIPFQINLLSLQHRLAQKLKLQMETRQELEPSTTPRFLDFIEQTVVVLDLETKTLESIGICGIASITSDLFSKFSAAIIVFMMLGYNSTSWSECHGTIDLTRLLIEVCSTVGITLIIDIPYTIYEMKEVGYDLGLVVETFSKVQMGWSLYAFLVCAAGSCLCTFITAEVNLFTDSQCFNKN